MSTNIDKFDQAILSALATDGRLSIATLANRIGLSQTPCSQRLRRLEKQGLIKGYQAILDYQKLGEAHVTFVQVVLENTGDQALNTFNQAVTALPEVEQCHMIAGNFDYLLKVRTRDIDHYRTFMSEKLAKLPYLAHSSTFVAIESICDRHKRP